jgi:hypothetical protein
MLNVVLRNVTNNPFMLSVVVLSVVAPYRHFIVAFAVSNEGIEIPNFKYN